MDFERGDLVTDGLLRGVVKIPLCEIDDELRTVIVLAKSKLKIDLDPNTLIKIEKKSKKR